MGMLLRRHRDIREGRVTTSEDVAPAPKRRRRSAKKSDEPKQDSNTEKE